MFVWACIHEQVGGWMCVHSFVGGFGSVLMYECGCVCVGVHS